MTLRKFGSPHLYVQGAGALDELPAVVEQAGRIPLLVADSIVLGLFRERIAALLGSDVSFAEFSGECTAEEIDKVAAEVRSKGADVVIGMGGGKAIDVAKGAGSICGLPVVIVPSIASNDSPTSRLSVLYTADHVIESVRMMARNPEAVIVDTQIIANAPVRFFVAGLGDALSKKFEVEEAVRAGAANFFGGRQTLLVQRLADTCFDILIAHGHGAAKAVEANTVTPELEDVVEAVVLMSGLAFENGGLSIAHSLTRGLSAIPALSGRLHGEQVAFGLLVQLVLQGGQEDLLARLTAFCSGVGLPTSLAALGAAREDAAIIAQTACDSAPYIGNFRSAVTPATLERAILRLAT